MLGRTPTAAEKAHMNLVGDMFCIACEKDGVLNSFISLHHVNGRTKPDAHFDVLPLCAPHHQHDDTDPWKRIGIHPYKARFEALYGTSDQLVNKIKIKIEEVSANARRLTTEQNPHQIYVARKKEWDKQNPNATPRQRNAAMHQISEECGI